MYIVDCEDCYTKSYITIDDNGREISPAVCPVCAKPLMLTKLTEEEKEELDNYE